MRRAPEPGDVWRDATPGVDRLVEVRKVDDGFVLGVCYTEFRDFGKEFEIVIPVERFGAPKGYLFERKSKK